MLRKLGKYELLEEIGHGGMATVYRARDVNLDREVAVKVMHPHLRKTPEARVRFTREARSVARLRHPNVLEIYDYGGEDEEESYISAELLTGPTLKDFVEAHEAHVPAEIAACFGVLLARALVAAHAKGIIHRDVKPENVLLHEARTAKLTDFGIAQMVDSQSFTATGQILGSPGHMAPEQIDGGDIGPRTDVFSLGTVLYFVALRRLPFTGRNPHQVLKRIADGEYADPLRVDPTIGATLAEIIDRCMARDPEARYASAGEVEEALSAFLAEMGIEDPEEALAEYLADPATIDGVLRQRALDRHLVLAEAAVARGDRPEALRHCNRILALDDGNTRALELVEDLSRPPRRWPLAVAVVAVLAVGVGAYAASRPDSPDPDPDPVPEVIADAGVVPVVPEDLGPADQGSTPPEDAGRAQVEPTTAMVRPIRSRTRVVQLAPTPQNVEIAIDGADFRAFGPSFREIELDVGIHRFRVRGGSCCEDYDRQLLVRSGDEPLRVALNLDFRDASLLVRVRDANGRTVHGPVTVEPDGRAAGATARTGSVFGVPMSDASMTRRVVVRGDFGQETRSVRLTAGGAPTSVEITLPP